MAERSFYGDPVLLQFFGFIKTPPLWAGKKMFPFPQFDLGERNFSETKNIPAVPNNIALGRRVEYFFQYYIEQFSSEEILANKVQIIPNKITVGELDFLLKNKNNYKITHVELVYKFYIYDPAFKIEIERWIGPNRRDSLVKKLEKLQNHQFPLLYKPETETILKNLDIKVSEVVQKTCFKAFVFLPKHFQNQKIPLINNECIVGYWLRFEDFVSKDYSEHLFYAPEKQDWPIEPQFNQIWYSFSEIREQILKVFQNKKSPLIWMKKSDTSFERFFVVCW